MLKIIIVPFKARSTVRIVPALGGVELVAAATPVLVGVVEVKLLIDVVVDAGTFVDVEDPIGGAVEVPTATPLIDRSRGTPYPKQRSSANWAVTTERCQFSGSYREKDRCSAYLPLPPWYTLLESQPANR